jgi:hypothetical protein
MELKGYNSEDPLFRESSVKSESRGGEIEMDKEKRRVTRREKDMSRARIAVLFHNNVSWYQYLHNRIADVFAELLKSDIEFLKSARLKGLVWPQDGVLLSIVSMIGEL